MIAADLVAGLQQIVNGTAAITAALDQATADWSDDLQTLVDAAVAITDARRDLIATERRLATEAGRVGGRKVGALSDGRQYTLKRAADRTSWDHEEWQHDTRAAVVTATLNGLDLPARVDLLTIDGEAVPFDLAAALHTALTQAQGVHGSTAPRSTALKALGLYAGDYATTTPAGWTLTAVKPPAQDTT